MGTCSSTACGRFLHTRVLLSLAAECSETATGPFATMHSVEPGLELSPREPFCADKLFDHKISTGQGMCNFELSPRDSSCAVVPPCWASAHSAHAHKQTAERPRAPIEYPAPARAHGSELCDDSTRRRSRAGCRPGPSSDHGSRARSRACTGGQAGGAAQAPFRIERSMVRHL